MVFFASVIFFPQNVNRLVIWASKQIKTNNEKAPINNYLQQDFIKIKGVEMKKTRIIAMGIIAILGLALIAPSANAGSRHRRNRHMLQGAAIGIGALMIGKALHDHARRPPLEARLPYHRYEPPPPAYHGHWEVRQVWVPPTYRQVWNPGHYNQRNRWIPGRYIEMVDRPGYWDEKRVWVAAQ